MHAFGTADIITVLENKSVRQVEIQLDYPRESHFSLYASISLFLSLFLLFGRNISITVLTENSRTIGLVRRVEVFRLIPMDLRD